MKKVIKKTKKEIKAYNNALVIKTTVKESHYYYYACNECEVAFFDDDIIISHPAGGKRCNNKVGLFRKKRCNHRLYGGDKECFDRHYKLPE